MSGARRLPAIRAATIGLAPNARRRISGDSWQFTPRSPHICNHSPDRFRLGSIQPSLQEDGRITLPFSSLTRTGELIAFVAFAIAGTVLAWWVGHLGASLAKTVPNGIVALELAWSPSRADAILRAWDVTQKSAAIRQTCWDFLFLIAYPLAFSFSCAIISHHVRSPLSDIGVAIAWLVLFAGLFDACENVCLLRMLRGGAQIGVSQTATACAAIKFALLASAVGFWTLAMLQAISDSFRSVCGSGSA
jgi:hypothetical protein